MPAQLREQEGLELSATAELGIFDGTTGLEDGSPCFGNACYEFTTTVVISGEMSDPSITGFEMSMEHRALIPFDVSLPIWQSGFRVDGEVQGTFQSRQGNTVATTMRIEERRSRVVTPVVPAGD